MARPQSTPVQLLLPITEPRICRGCGGPFTPKRKSQVVCSRACTAASRRKQPTECPRCGRMFVRLGRKVHPYCGYPCQTEARLKLNAALGHKPGEVPRVCQLCGETFYRYPSLMPNPGDGKYCNRTCHQRAQVGVAPPHFDRYMGKDAPPTSIETALYAALEELRLPYERQHYLGPCRVDAYLPETRTVIECLGDFWHTNPRRFPDGPQYPSQREATNRDHARRAWLTERGFPLIELWEMDINERGALVLLQEALGL